MDVRAWLQHTVDREPPDNHENCGFPDFLNPQRHAEDVSRRNHRKRKRASSEPANSPRRRGYTAYHRNPGSRSSDRRANRRASSRASRQTESEHSRSSAREPPGKSYERRPRHKTRPDRYELKPQKQAKEQDTRNEKKSKSKKRKSHPTGDGTRTAALVQNFQLKNGPKTNRLTLHPSNAGIFKHGRSSAQVAAGGPGLPDLVFNEMKFLQRPKEHQNEVSVEVSTKQSIRKTRKQLQEEEISTYFARKPQLEEQNRTSHGSAAPSDHSEPARDRTARQASTAGVNDQTQRPPLVDIEGNAFLGFGGGGHARDTSNGKASNSYYTWSESLPAHHFPIATTTHPAKEQIPGMRPLSSTVRRRRQDDCDNRNGNERRTAQADEAGEWVQTKRVKGLTLVEMYQAPPPRARPSPAQSSSQALPEQSYLGQDGGSIEQDIRRPTESFRTSDILEIHKSRSNACRSSSLHRDGFTAGDFVNKENHDPSTSTPTSKLLRQAFGTVTHLEDASASHHPQVHFRDSHHEQHRFADERREESAVDAFPGNMLYEVERPASRRRELWSLPERGFSRATGDLLSRDPVSYNVSLVPLFATRDVDRYSERGSIEHPRSGQAPQRLPTVTRIPSRDPPRFYTSGQQTEALVRQLALNDRPELHGPRYSRLPDQQHNEFDPSTNGHDAAVYDAPSAGNPSMTPSGNIYADHGSGRQVSGGPGVVPKPGFWKPNILY